MLSRSLLFSGAAAGFLSVVLGAFAAHAMKGKFPAESMGIFETAVRYQMFHALALLITGILLKTTPHPAFQAAGLFFLLGMVFFPAACMRWFSAESGPGER